MCVGESSFVLIITPLITTGLPVGTDQIEYDTKITDPQICK